MSNWGRWAWLAAALLGAWVAWTELSGATLPPQAREQTRRPRAPTSSWRRTAGGSRAVAIKGWRVEAPPEPAAPNGHDRVLIADASAPLLWARFYQIGTDRPVYSGRDGVIKHSLAEIELERRSGYNWIDRFAATLLESDYPAWRKATGR